jgi:hypothetical protein
VKKRQGGRSQLPPLARSARSFFGSALTSFRDVEFSSNCLAKRELDYVSCATTFRSTAVAVAKFAKAPKACSARSSSLVRVIAALANHWAPTVSPCICLCWR